MATAIADLGLTPPKDMKAAADHLAALEVRLKALPSEIEARRPTVDALAADPAADLTELAQAELLRDVESQALAEATARARDRLTAVTLQLADELVIQAREKVFAPALAKLAAAAALPRNADLAQLVAAGRQKDAEALTLAPIAAEQIRACLSLRDRLCRNETARLACRVWKNPSSIDWAGAEATTGTERYVEGLRRGGELWLGTYAEVDDADRQAKAAAKAKKVAAVKAADRKMRDAIAADRARRAERAAARA